MSRFIKHESCPNCGSRDNLGRYSDGSAWCFGCHYREPATGRSLHTQRDTHSGKEHFKAAPEDIGFHFPDNVLKWINQYDITMEELYERRVRYSPQRQQLVFLFDHNIWQARNFAEGAKSRYFTQGEVNEHLPVYRSSGGIPVVPRTCVLVEDCISAIKVARQCDAMPLLGSNISYTKLARLKHFYEQLIFWLDADKYKESQKLAARAKLLGLSTDVVYSSRDPKEQSDETISEVLSHAGINS